MSLHYPFVIIAWRHTKVKDFRIKEEIVKNEQESINFRDRYSKPGVIIKTRGLNNDEKAQLGLSLDDLPAENPQYQEKSDEQKITPQRIISFVWNTISKNPLVSAIVATIVATLILKFFNVI